MYLSAAAAFLYNVKPFMIALISKADECAFAKKEDDALAESSALCLSSDIMSDD
jgi:hypothetical protein